VRQRQFRTSREKTKERQFRHQLQRKRKYYVHDVALNTAAHAAAANDQLEVLRMLADNGFNFRGGEDLKNN